MAKPIRIIGDLDSQRSDKWNSTVLEFKKCRNLFRSGALYGKRRQRSGQVCLEGQSYILLNGNVENHNVLMWYTERRRIDAERQRDPSNCSLLCAMSVSSIYGPMFLWIQRSLARAIWT
jgi:hypothetical protein